MLRSSCKAKHKRGILLVLYCHSETLTAHVEGNGSIIDMTLQQPYSRNSIGDTEIWNNQIKIEIQILIISAKCGNFRNVSKHYPINILINKLFFLLYIVIVLLNLDIFRPQTFSKAFLQKILLITKMYTGSWPFSISFLKHIHALILSFYERLL